MMLTKKQAQGKLLNFRQYVDAVLEFLKDDTITPDDAVSKVVRKADVMLEEAAKQSAGQEAAAE
jgi:hypothetical protein